MLEFFTVADVAAEFGAVELSVSLEFAKGLPDDLSSSIVSEASVRELAEVDTIPKNLVHFLHEITSSMAVRARSI